MKKALVFLILTAALACSAYFCTAAGPGYKMYYSDITAYINHHPVPSFSYDGQTVVRAEDLRYYGFDVAFSAETMTLEITRNDQCFVEGISFKKPRVRSGRYYDKGEKSNVKVVAGGAVIPSFSYGGCSMVKIEDLSALGSVVWVPQLRAIKLWVDGVHIIDYAPVEYEPAPQIDPSKPMIALTFDDGPGDGTASILDTLENYGAKATFFVVGSRAEGHKSLLKREADLGMEIGSHTNSHAFLTNYSDIGIKNEISYADYEISKITGSNPTLLRPPGGFWDSRVARICGKPIIMWSVDTLDWKNRYAAAVSAKIMTAADGDIVLMHDLYPTTAEAVKSCVPALINKGFQLVTVSELAYYKGYKLQNGIAVSSINHS